MVLLCVCVCVCASCEINVVPQKHLFKAKREKKSQKYIDTHSCITAAILWEALKDA